MGTGLLRERIVMALRTSRPRFYPFSVIDGNNNDKASCRTMERVLAFSYFNYGSNKQWHASTTDSTYDVHGANYLVVHSDYNPSNKKYEQVKIHKHAGSSINYYLTCWGESLLARKIVRRLSSVHLRRKHQELGRLGFEFNANDNSLSSVVFRENRYSWGQRLVYPRNVCVSEADGTVAMAGSKESSVANKRTAALLFLHAKSDKTRTSDSTGTWQLVEFAFYRSVYQFTGDGTGGVFAHNDSLRVTDTTAGHRMFGQYLPNSEITDWGVGVDVSGSAGAYKLTISNSKATTGKVAVCTYFWTGTDTTPTVSEDAADTIYGPATISITDSSYDASTKFGFAIASSLNATTLVVGSPGNNTAVVYNSDGSNSPTSFAWSYAEKLQSTFTPASDGEFGRDVSISTDGKLVAIGGPSMDTEGDLETAGVVFAYCPRRVAAAKPAQPAALTAA